MVYRCLVRETISAEKATLEKVKFYLSILLLKFIIIRYCDKGKGDIEKVTFYLKSYTLSSAAVLKLFPMLETLYLLPLGRARFLEKSAS